MNHSTSQSAEPPPIYEESTKLSVARSTTQHDIQEFTRVDSPRSALNASKPSSLDKTKILAVQWAQRRESMQNIYRYKNVSKMFDSPRNVRHIEHSTDSPNALRPGTSRLEFRENLSSFAPPSPIPQQEICLPSDPILQITTETASTQSVFSSSSTTLCLVYLFVVVLLLFMFKSCSALELFMRTTAAAPREVALMKALIGDDSASRNVPGKVKVSAPQLHAK
ncbi:unnamed protein product, partial [Mesorhabditis belari]|uniref:Uncharacterized protein n=1 Tax=Mesorhabditis belari TaxID=2138241 RepID=A0AAF3EZI1_9BILA